MTLSTQIRSDLQKLFEDNEQQPHKQQQKTASDQKLFNDFWQQLLNASNVDQAAVPVEVKNNVEASFMRNISSGEQTRAKLKNVGNLSPEQVLSLAQHTLNMDLSGLEDIISDEEAARIAGVSGTPTTPTTPEDLPAVISRALSTKTGVEVEWHMVKHLPGYLSGPIRAMGRAVFSPFTSTPIEDIQVLANVGGGGPNTPRELNAVAAWLQKTGDRLPDLTIAFSERIPGYEAEIATYNALGFTFIVVKDFMGVYIYSWPQSDTKMGKPVMKVKNNTGLKAVSETSRAIEPVTSVVSANSVNLNKMKRAIYDYVIKSMPELKKAGLSEEATSLSRETDTFWVSGFSDAAKVLANPVPLEIDTIYEALAFAITEVSEAIVEFYRNPWNHAPGFKPVKMQIIDVDEPSDNDLKKLAEEILGEAAVKWLSPSASNKGLVSNKGPENLVELVKRIRKFKARGWEDFFKELKDNTDDLDHYLEKGIPEPKALDALNKNSKELEKLYKTTLGPWGYLKTVSAIIFDLTGREAENTSNALEDFLLTAEGKKPPVLKKLADAVFKA